MSDARGDSTTSIERSRDIVEPRISVVVPVYNAEATIGAQLEGLAVQTFGEPWELIVVDNGSSDGTRAVAEGWLAHIDRMKIVDASGKQGPSFARNTGAAAATAGLLAFCDADDVVHPDWLGALAKALQSHDFVVGRIDDRSLNKGTPANWFDLRTEGGDPTRTTRFLPWAGGSNFAISRSAFQAVDGFDEDLRHGQDKDLSWRVQLAGYPLHFAKDAVVSYRRRRDAGAMWRQYVGFGRSDVLLYARFRGEGLPRSSWTRALRAYATLLVTSPRLLLRKRRGSWLRAAAIRWGRIRGSVHERVLYL
jgi:glycosyltransferase involved in cell wall biosynthesis